MIGESSAEAIDRAAQVAIDAIAEDAGLRTADQLEPGCMVKVCGDWYRFDGLNETGGLRLATDAGEFQYGPTSGERFVVF